MQWVYEPGSFRPLAQLEQQNGATQLHYIVTDLTGTARELCSEEGDVHWRGEQALWGEYREARTPLALRRWLGDAANDEVSCDLRYPGQLYDAESGLYYNRHRYYDPELGQYISPDPIGMLGGLRPQGYVHNPLEWMDPFGLSDSTILDRAMGGQVGDRLSAHHVIPVEVWKENGAFLDKIGMGNQMNAGFNGIHVPGSQTAMTTGVGKGMNVFHSSNHNNYSNTVRDELSYIKEQYDMGELTDREARDAVRKLQIDMKNKIWRGDVSQTKCGRMN